MTVRFTVDPRRPYSLALTAERYTRFPEAVDRFDGRTYRRLLTVGSRTVLLSVEQEGPPSRATLKIRLDGAGAGRSASREAALRVVELALGAASDVGPFYRAHRNDALLGRSIRDFRGLRVSGLPSLWEALVTAILAQQVNLKFAYDIRRELAETFGRRARFDGDTFVAFPSPEALGEETASSLRRFRLSDAKANAIVGLARAFAGGALAETDIAALPDGEAVERLIAFRGVGRWTAEIALMRGLGRTDIFPAGDLGVVKYLAQGLLGRPAKAKEDEMRRFAERWRPHRSFALVYGYAEINRRKGSQPLRPPGERRPGPESLRSRGG